MLLASVVFLVVFTALNVMQGGSLSITDWLFGVLGVGLIFWLLVQWGFLACAVSLLCAKFLTFPLTTDWSVWYAPHGFAGLALVGLIALVGFFNSRDRPTSRLAMPI
jgi:hypothetical protein